MPDLVDDALAICAVPAPTGAEDARGALVRDRLRDAGLKPKRDAVGNITARIGGVGAAVVVAAHLDTVFSAETPLDPVRDGDVLRGPGIGDNAVAVAALLALARSLGSVRPAVPILLAATVGEEGRGDLRGMRALLDEEDVAAVIAVEGHGVECLVTAAVGSARFEAVHRGPGGHSWGDQGRPSALHSLFDAGLHALEVAAPAVVNIGVAGGGTTVNTIAAEARLEIDLRSEDEEVLEGAADRVVEALGQAPEGIETRVRPIGRRPGGRLPYDHPLLRAARRARAAAGLPEATEEAASTDANAALGRGLPALTVGLTSGDNVHRPDEWIRIEPLAQGYDALERLVRAAARA